MLCRNTYPMGYIEACRAKAAAQMARYRAMAKTADAAALADFEPDFCNAMILSLETFFMHRARGFEGKDGNPANEVRMLANALMNGDGEMTADRTIKYDPAKSVLGLKIGDPIRLTADDFERLAAAYFVEIYQRYAADAAV